jgi:hypothetical protein
MPDDSCKNIESFERNWMDEKGMWGSTATVNLIATVAYGYSPQSGSDHAHGTPSLSRMLKKPASLSCSFGLFGLSRLFG